MPKKKKVPMPQLKIPHAVVRGFPGSSAGKESTCNVGHLGLIPRLGRCPGDGEQLPRPVFWPGEFHGVYSCKELDMTE